MANPNLMNITSSTLVHGAYTISGGLQVYIVSNSTNHVRVCTNLTVTNSTANPVNFTCWASNATNGTKYYLYDIDVPAYTSETLVTKDNPLYVPDNVVILSGPAAASGISFISQYEDYS